MTEKYTESRGCILRSIRREPALVIPRRAAPRRLAERPLSPTAGRPVAYRLPVTGHRSPLAARSLARLLKCSGYAAAPHFRRRCSNASTKVIFLKVRKNEHFHLANIFIVFCTFLMKIPLKMSESLKKQILKNFFKAQIF